MTGTSRCPAASAQDGSSHGEKRWKREILKSDKKRWKRKKVALPEKLDQIRCSKVDRDIESPNSGAAWIQEGQTIKATGLRKLCADSYLPSYSQRSSRNHLLPKSQQIDSSFVNPFYTLNIHAFSSHCKDVRCFFLS
jgi:hypothetical protein